MLSSLAMTTTLLNILSSLNMNMMSMDDTSTACSLVENNWVGHTMERDSAHQARTRTPRTTRTRRSTWQASSRSNKQASKVQEQEEPLMACCATRTWTLPRCSSRYVCMRRVSLWVNFYHTRVQATKVFASFLFGIHNKH